MDESSRMMVAGYATNAVADAAQLVPVLNDIKINTGKNPKRLTADAGYSARDALAEMKKRGVEGFVPQRVDSSKGYPVEDFSYDPDNDHYICPEGKILKLINKEQGSLTYQARNKDCRACKVRTSCMRFRTTVSPRSLRISVHSSLIDEMKQRTSSELGTRMARKRSSTVETVFAHLKYIRKLRRFIYRGMNMINNIWKFELAVYNLEQIIRLHKLGRLRIAT